MLLFYGAKHTAMANQDNEIDCVAEYRSRLADCIAGDNTPVNWMFSNPLAILCFLAVVALFACLCYIRKLHKDYDELESWKEYRETQRDEKAAELKLLQQDYTETVGELILLERAVENSGLGLTVEEIKENEIVYT